MKNWKSMLCFVLTAACATPAATASIFAQDFDETSQISSDVPFETINEAEALSDENSTDTPADSSETPDETDSAVDASGYSWYKDPKTVYEAGVYADELGLKTDVTNEEEKKAVESEKARMAKYLSDHETQEMHRLYNPNSGEHFYTASTVERDHLVSLGWKSEGTGWLAPKNTGEDVYRLYNPNAGDHHYTLSAEERDALVKLGWKDEGIGWKSADKADTGNVLEVWREYNPNEEKCNHNFTTDAHEHRTLARIGWNDEDIAWYALSPVSKVTDSDGNVTMYDNASKEQLKGEQTLGGEIYYLDEAQDGKMHTGKLELGGKLYIHDDNGKRLTGLVEYKGDTYFLDYDNGAAFIGTKLVDETTKTPRFVTFDNEGKMVKGRTYNGCRYSSTGTKMDLTKDEELELLCNSVYNEVGRDLHNVYNWTWQNLSYTKFDPEWRTPPQGYTYEQNFAFIGLQDRRGNAYTYAATFATLARNLGYDAQLVKGEIRLTTGWTEHGWVKINIDGKEYYYDPTFERSQKGDGNLCWQQDPEKPKYSYRVS